MICDVLKDTVLYRLNDESSAKEKLNQIKEENAQYKIEYSLKQKNKKSKGEIIEEWVELTVTIKYTD